jgi:hypothetical protein
MSLLNAYNRILWRDAAQPSSQSKLPKLEYNLGLTLLTVVFAWTAQIIFWRLLGWVVSFRMSLFWLALPIGAYFLAALAAATPSMRAFAKLSGPVWLSPVWLRTGAWVLLTGLCTALSILNQSILLFSVAAALFGAGLSPLLRQALLALSSQPRIVLIGATLCGVVIGVAATSGTLFVNQHLLQLTLAFTCCLAFASASSRLYVRDNIPPATVANAGTQAESAIKTESVTQAACGVMMAAPIALTPILEAVCGVGFAGFGLAFVAHYGAMLLPGFFVGRWRHTFSSYVLSAAYVASMVFGHVLPLLYLAKV